jgi:peroxin-7
MTNESSWDTQDAVYDIAWSEKNENQLIAATGDGSVKLFDVSVPEGPVQQWQEHNREVYAVTWNLQTKDTFASSSWDGTIKVVSDSTHRGLPPNTDILISSTRQNGNKPS